MEQAGHNRSAASWSGRGVVPKLGSADGLIFSGVAAGSDSRRFRSASDVEPGVAFVVSLDVQKMSAQPFRQSVTILYNMAAAMVAANSY